MLIFHRLGRISAFSVGAVFLFWFLRTQGQIQAGAVAYLRKAINEGYTDARKVFADSDFALLHGFPAFEELAATFDGR
jgi:hypothetical protein